MPLTNLIIGTAGHVDHGKSALIRRAVDEYLDTDADDELRLARFRAAVDAVAGAAPDLPQGSLYVERLRALDASRQEEIERRRRA